MSTIERFRHAWGNGSRWRILGVALAVSMVWACGVLIYAKTRPEPFAPLAYQTAPQAVLGDQELVTVGGVNSNVVVLNWDGEHPPSFETTGSKCNNSGQTIKKRTERNYSAVAPVGSVIGDDGSVTDMIPGCTTRTRDNPYVNVVPQAVLDRAATLSARTGDKVTLWQFRGIETPIDGSGGPGVPAYWQSDTFGIRVP